MVLHGAIPYHAERRVWRCLCVHGQRRHTPIGSQSTYPKTYGQPDNRRRKIMTYVYLDNKYNEFFIDEATYAQVVALVQAHKHCTYSSKQRHLYTDDNPCVGRNLCLEHLLEKQKHLAYAGSLAVDSENRRMHRFVDSKGMIYTSTEDYSEEAKEDL